MIQIVDLHKKFGDNHVLRGVNLTFERCETTVIIGRSGCGKSVLVKHLIGLLKPNQGKIIVDGEDITNYRGAKLFRLRRKFGMLFQGSALLDSMTVGENVGLGLRHHTALGEEAIQERVKSRLALVGLSGLESLYPAELSGGMKKRVGLARAMALDPQYVIFDEPTTGLDPIMADVINELIIRLQKELCITSIAVTHDMVSATKIADRIAMLHEGRIIFDGTPEQIRQSKDPIVQQFIQGSASGPIKPV
ncbi:MAG: ABC transporter [candidate division Zixibacteria bacterium SM23_81]|nr:MAG: ABC transporter [candidate division Zixibacteria bacterium SM23_81]